MQSLLDHAVEDLCRKAFWHQFQADARRIREDPEEWAEYQREVRLFEGTLADGLAGW